MAANCSDWPTQDFFFEAKTAAEVEACLSKGHSIHDLEHGTDRTPLHQAAGWSPPAVVSALLAAGADIEARNIHGMTPLMDGISTFGHDLETLRTLIDAGASLTTEDPNHQNALALAGKHAKAETVELLLSCGADPNVRLGDGMTPLFHAVNRNETGPAKAMIVGGSDVNTVFGNGMTPLGWAAKFGFGADMAKVLLEAGAQTDIVFPDGETVLSLLQQNSDFNADGHKEGFAELVKMLIV